MTIYTDGGCTGNPGPGGWAAVLIAGSDEPVVLSGGDPSTTNNRMELTAVIRALEKTLELRGEGARIEVHTDSQYVQKGISQWIKGWEAKGWRTASGDPVKNKDLWLVLSALNRRVRADWRWVKGHAGNRWNEACDALVAEQRSRFGG